MYKKVNPNPLNKAVGDCTVRALCIAENIEWETAYMELCTEGFRSADMPSSNEVMERLLLGMGYKKEIIKTNCNDCFTIKDFCKSNPEGIYILATGTHVVAVIDGNYLDSWDSGDKIPLYFYTKTLRS